LACLEHRSDGDGNDNGRRVRSVIIEGCGVDRRVPIQSCCSGIGAAAEKIDVATDRGGLLCET
jgi:hypothetical protein